LANRSDAPSKDRSDGASFALDFGSGLESINKEKLANPRATTAITRNANSLRWFSSDFGAVDAVSLAMIES
jgi:hypothetical protein